MTPGPLPADKRLLAKRTVRKIAKKVRSSRKPQSARSCIEEVWHILENPNSDDVSKMCSRQLLLLRVQLKDKVRGYFNGECSFEDLVQHTGLTREAVMATLGKHNAFHRDTDDRVNDDKLGQGVPSVEITDDGRKECNATFVVPKLDISDVRKDAPSSDDDDTSKSEVVVEEVNHHPEPTTPLRSLLQEPTIHSNQSPREVTDSSAEISDLAKRLGARLFQDTSMFEQLRKVKREKSFVEQLREIVASSTITESSAKQLQFIPSTPIAKRPIPITIECREIDVQTSIRIGELPAITKEMRDTATDVPSLDYLSMSELGGLRQLPDNFIIQEDISSSAISSDQSAGQVPGSMVGRIRTTIAVNRDGSVQFTPAKAVTVSELNEDSFPRKCVDREFTQFPAHPPQSSFNASASPRTPRISGSPWRPSSRRLHLEEVDISTSHESNSIEVVSVASAHTPAAQPETNSSQLRKVQEMVVHDLSLVDVSSKGSSDLSHQDEEHTYNQVSQIVSE